MSQSIEAQVRHMADLAWAAGVIDSVGELTAIPRSPRGFSPRIRVRTRLPQARDTLARLEATLGGSTGNVTSSRGRLMVVWQVSGAKGCLEALDALRPYLVRHQRAAQLLEELCQRIVDYSPATFEDRTIPHSEFEERLKLARALAYSRVPKL